MSFDLRTKINDLRFMKYRKINWKYDYFENQKSLIDILRSVQQLNINYSNEY